MARIVLDRIAHSYGVNAAGVREFALKPLTMTWNKGGAYALLGPSGCGKTTLLNIISGLITPTEGRVRFDDRDVTEVPTEQRNIAQVFQFPVVYDTMTVAQNLAFPLRNRGMSAAGIERRVQDIAKRLELDTCLGRRAQGLTADVKQKVSLGRGLVRPDVAAILFDEPLTVIDPQLKWMLRSQLKHLHRQFDFTMIYVTHDQTEALTFADQVVVMHEGDVVQAGTPEQLFHRPVHTFVGHFIGSPGMNIVPAAVAGDRAIVNGLEIGLGRAYPTLPAAARIELGVRPEAVAFSADGRGHPVTLERLDDLGRYRIARVSLAGCTLNVLVPEEAEADLSGGEPRIVFDPDRVNVYADGHLVEGEAR
ncbi:MAG: ATP-binding cassette domain-containing protein [Azospirillum sp.]|nr:ATP-binding cassette domain-containing protein [Azospirillum sp.]